MMYEDYIVIGGLACGLAGMFGLVYMLRKAGWL